MENVKITVHPINNTIKILESNIKASIIESVYTSVTAQQVVMPIRVITSNITPKIIGLPGLQGPPGLAGSAGGPVALFNDLEDVVIINVQSDQLIKYNDSLKAWVNVNTLDGGNF